MRWRQVLKNLVRTAGELGQELKNAFRELIKTFPSIDKDRMPDPKQVIRELKQRAKMIVSMLDDETLTATQAAQQAGFKSGNSGACWVKRLNEDGIQRLCDKQKSGKPRIHSDEVRVT